MTEQSIRSRLHIVGHRLDVIQSDLSALPPEHRGTEPVMTNLDRLIDQIGELTNVVQKVAIDLGYPVTGAEPPPNFVVPRYLYMGRGAGDLERLPLDRIPIVDMGQGSREQSFVQAGPGHSFYDLARDRIDRRFGEGEDAAHEAIRSNPAARAIYECAVGAVMDLLSGSTSMVMGLPFTDRQREYLRAALEFVWENEGGDLPTGQALTIEEYLPMQNVLDGNGDEDLCLLSPDARAYLRWCVYSSLEAQDSGPPVVPNDRLIEDTLVMLGRPPEGDEFENEDMRARRAQPKGGEA